MPIDARHLLRAVWSMFESRHIRAAVLRGDGQSPVPGGDYDILVHSDDLADSVQLIMSVAKELGWRPLFNQRVSNHHHLGFWHKGDLDAERLVSLHLDLQDALGKKGFLYARAEPFVEKIEYRQGVGTLRAEASTVALALHVLLDKGSVRPEYRSLLQGSSGQALEAFAERVLPRSSARTLCSWIRSGAPESDMGSASSRIRSSLRIAYPLNLIRPILIRFRRMLRYFGSRRGVLIAFLGPDGSGKSTTLEAVRATSARGAFPIKSVYMGKRDTFLPTSALIRMLHQRESGSNGQSGPVPKRSGINQFLFYFKDIAGLLNWVLEQWARYLVQVRPFLQQDGLVLTDRYAFDLGNRDIDSLAHKRFFRRLLPYLFPVPDRTYLLWEDPDVLYSRKPEMSIEQFEKLLGRLREIVDFVPDSSRIRTNRSVKIIAAQITADIAALMETRCRT